VLFPILTPVCQWHSPQILMLSGVGPSQTLQKYNIPVVADLPGVGQGARVRVLAFQKGDDKEEQVVRSG